MFEDTWQWDQAAAAAYQDAVEKGLDRIREENPIDTLAHRYTGKPYIYPGGDTPQNRFSIHIKPTRISGNV